MAFWIAILVGLIAFSTIISFLFIKLAFLVMELVQMVRPEVKKRKELSAIEKLQKQLKQLRGKGKKNKPKPGNEVEMNEAEQKNKGETW